MGSDCYLVMQGISKVEDKIHAFQTEMHQLLSRPCSFGSLVSLFTTSTRQQELPVSSHGVVYLRAICRVSFRGSPFLLASLGKLVAANKPETIKITTWCESNKERRELLMWKGVYPYEYID